MNKVKNDDALWNDDALGLVKAETEDALWKIAPGLLGSP